MKLSRRTPQAQRTRVAVRRKVAKGSMKNARRSALMRRIRKKKKKLL